MKTKSIVRRASVVAGLAAAVSVLGIPQSFAANHPTAEWTDGRFSSSSVVVNPTNVKSYGKLADLGRVGGGTALWVRVQTTTGDFNQQVGQVGNRASATQSFSPLSYTGSFLRGWVTVCSSTIGGGCGVAVPIYL